MYAKLGLQLRDELIQLVYTARFKGSFMRVIIGVLAILLFTAAIPPQASANYIGMQLGRPAVADFTLTDQNNESYRFYDTQADVIVVSFIFTRCPDFCPIITQKLKTVEVDIPSNVNAEMISITVDPNHDTPEKLKLYMEKHGVSWTHLTGTYDEVSPVLDAFIINEMQQTRTVPDESNDSEEITPVSVSPWLEENQSVTLVDNSGQLTEYTFSPSAYDFLEAMARQEGWTLNVSTSEWGHYVDGINDVNRAEDWSWSWGFYLWNQSSNTWMESMYGVDEISLIDYTHLAFAPYGENVSNISSPVSTHPSIEILYPNGTRTNGSMDSLTAGEMSTSAFYAADISFNVTDSSWGRYVESIKNESDTNWWWQLHQWNEENSTWDDSLLGMDSLENPKHIAWAPNGTNHSEIIAPSVFACDEYGWIMGTGDQAHCMCDAGYTWPEGDMLSCEKIGDGEPTYTVAHNTITYLLNRDYKPLVAWAGSEWKESEMVTDIIEVSEFSKNTDSDDGGFLPGFTIPLTLSATFCALLMVDRRIKDKYNEKK